MRPVPVTDLTTGGAPHGGSSARVTRHHLADRLYHWIMAASVVALLITSFFPIFGWKFPWVAKLLERKPAKVVAIAVANKLARIAWALMSTGQNFRAHVRTTILM